MRAFYGNFGNLVRGYTYVRSMGAEGLREAAEMAVLNANYMLSRLRQHFDLPYDRICKHEFVLSGRRQRDRDHVTTKDMAKRLLDYGFHSPTIYFPLIVEEAIMIEPTETESLQTLDTFVDAMIAIARGGADGSRIWSARRRTRRPSRGWTRWRRPGSSTCGGGLRSSAPLPLTVRRPGGPAACGGPPGMRAGRRPS